MRYKEVSLEIDFALALISELSDAETGRLFSALLKYMNGEEDIQPIGNEKYVWPSLRSYIRKHCKKDCRGENHWNWKGGTASESQKIRNSPEYCAWRKGVFVRDNFTCQMCGQFGGYLEAHHIKPFSEYPELRLDLDNGITLCRGCHRDLHGKKRCGHGT